MRTKEDIFKIAYGRLRMKGEVSGSPNFAQINARYQWRRRSGWTSARALAAAVKVKAGPKDFIPPCIGAPDKNGHRCVVGPTAFGLRFANYSDDAIGASRGHQGWYTSDDAVTDEVYRGCVFRIPGRNGKSRYLAGYRDVAGDCYVVDFRKIYEGIPDTVAGALYEAATAGNGMAEIDAEECREHNEKWQKAQEWQELHAALGNVQCGCASADSERDRLRLEINAIEGDFHDIADFARENL